MGFSSPPPPPQVIMPPPAAHAPQLGSSATTQAGQNQTNNAVKAAGSGFDGTIATSPQGDPSGTNKAFTTLLGQ